MTPKPPIRHDDGTVTLWHDDSPGVRLRVRPSLLRRLGLIRHPFTTLGERSRYYAAQEGIRLRSPMLCRIGLHLWPRYINAHTHAPAPIRCTRCQKARR